MKRMRPLHACCLTLALLAAPLAALAQAAPAADRSADHDALRGLLAKGAQALNKRDFDGIAPSLHADFTIVTADSRKHVGLEAFRKYFLGLFQGSGAVLRNFETKLEADDETRFLDANTGVTYGTSQDTFTFTDGEVRTMRTRWTAVTRKEGGAWQLVNVHFSTNVLDNPVLDGTKAFYQKLAAAGAVLGLLLGALIVTLFRRRPR
jgi:uncharacterized protein (TIGR02246 family)